MSRTLSNRLAESILEEIHILVNPHISEFISHHLLLFSVIWNANTVSVEQNGKFVKPSGIDYISIFILFNVQNLSGDKQEVFSVSVNVGPYTYRYYLILDPNR